MLASSPSPSAALRPGSSSSPSAHSHPVFSSSSSQPAPVSSPPLSQQANQTYPYPPPVAHHCHYEPARSSSTTIPTTNNNYDNGNNQFSPYSSRVAIEELRSALNRHTVESSPHGPSGDLPRGRMPAGLNSLGGGSHPTGSHSGATPTSQEQDISRSGSDHPLSHQPSGQALTTSTANNTTTASASASSSTSSGAPTAPVPPPIPPSTTSSSVPPEMPARTTSGSNKRNSRDDQVVDATEAQHPGSADLEGSQSKRLRPSKSSVRVLPRDYDQADPRDIVVLISSMLMELIRFNDKIPLHQGRLTRFHSRSPPRISVHDYLQRLTTHATLSPPILLSMVYYIDRLCALYPAFNVSSLTIHRFLIASATVASKGLSDSFWTNKTYARVGGISLTELALLELEFLFRVEWRIVPQPEVLVDYYQSLVERCDGYEIVRG